MTFIMFLSAPRIISSITIATLLNFYHYHFWFEFISPVSFYGFMKSEEFYVMFIDIKFQSSLLCLTSCWCLFLNCQSRITEFGWFKFHVLLCQSFCVMKTWEMLAVWCTILSLGSWYTVESTFFLLTMQREISTLLARSFFMKFSITVLAVLARIRVLIQQVRIVISAKHLYLAFSELLRKWFMFYS